MRVLLKMIFLVIPLFAWKTELKAQDHSGMTMSDSASHIMLTEPQFKWMDAPPGLPKGAKVAVLSGDPTKAEHFTIRVMFPANYQVKPHWHATAENITVISGALFMGTQETFNQQMATKLEKGSFAVMPAKFVHYAFCKTPTVVQIHGMGPFSINYVNMADDPRNN